MMNFDEFLLKEMPHYNLPSGQVIDLELEVYTKKSSQEFLDYIVSILKGQPVKTKYNTKFRIKEKADRDFLKSKIMNDSMFIKPFIQKFHPEIEDQLWLLMKKI